MAADVTIRITGVGSSQEITVESGSTLNEALDAAGVSPEDAGLDVEVNGAPVEDAAETPVQDGDQVTTTPKNVRLGA